MKKVKNDKKIESGVFKHKRKIIFLLFLILILIRPLFTVFNQTNKFFDRNYSVQYEDFKSMYSNSQYVKKENPAIIPDELFESFAGGAFLKGLNPILIVHDHPPMGRYIVALSIIFFDNANTIILPMIIISAVGLFLTSRLVLKNNSLSLIPVGIFINEPLFINKLIYTPLPEPILLPFIIFSLYFFIKAILDKNYLRWFVLTAIMLGFVISIRFFVLGGVLVISMLLFLLIRKRDMKQILVFLSTLPISLIILILSYTRTIILGYSVLDVFSIQKYILDYHKSKFILPLTYWDLLLFNRWHTWWGNRAIMSDENWIIAWPISVFINAVSIVVCAVKKIRISNSEFILMLWVLLYSLLLSTGYTSTRYFLPVVPYLYILAVSFVTRFILYLRVKM